MLWFLGIFSSQSLIPILGPDIVLHGIKLWKPTNETARRLQLDGQSGQCDEVANVVLGSNARILKGSQMYTGNLRQRLLSKIAALDTYQNHAHVEDVRFSLAPVSFSLQYCRTHTHKLIGLTFQEQPSLM